MLAAENGALPGGKVGGMGDVLRDLPRALTAAGCDVSVMTPAYGVYAKLPGMRRKATVAVRFGQVTEEVGHYALPRDEHGVVHHVLDHPRFAPQGRGRIYCSDAADSPFYTDATKFAFFSAAAAAVVAHDGPDLVHLHDWHLGTYLALRAFDRRYAVLQQMRTVFTIHNLSLQGTRPFSVTDSSWAAWFPWLNSRWPDLVDPVHVNCVNPMAVGVRLADMVNTVSPTYALEMQRPNDPTSGFHGGEGLEKDLVKAHEGGRLIGILNGCEYPASKPRRPGWKRLTDIIGDALHAWIAAERNVRSAHYLAERRIDRLPGRRPTAILTSIGRLTAQKASLFRETVGPAKSALDWLLDRLAPGELFILLGSGDPDFERFFAQIAAARDNFVFLNGYADSLAEALYASGDLFLMPSSFEPCGISQLLAMRAGQPCVAHAVGGLRDTVTETNGFPFAGHTVTEQAQHFVETVAMALELRRSDPGRWKGITAAAAAQRFDWKSSAAEYLERVYAVATD